MHVMHQTDSDIKLSPTEKSRQNQLKVLQLLAEFSWLTTHQIGQLIYGKSKNYVERTNKLLERLRFECLIESQVLRKKQRKVNGKMLDCSIKGWFLIEGGKWLVEEKFPNQRFNLYMGDGTYNYETGKYIYISESKVYHRFLCNQYLIDLRIGLNSSFDEDEPEFVALNEAYIQSKNERVMSDFGCLPDSITKEGQMITSVEVENTARGPRNHGKKLFDFLDTFCSRYESGGVYTGDFRCLPELGEFDCLEVSFVCPSHKSFRNIWRHVEKRLLEMKQNRLEAASHIRYFVCNNKYRTENWTSPFEVEPQCFTHYSEQAHELEYSGRNPHGDDEDRYEILKRGVDNDWSAAQIAREEGVDVSTIYRWDQKLNVLLDGPAKEKILKEGDQNEWSAEEIAQEHELDVSTIERWKKELAILRS